MTKQYIIGLGCSYCQGEGAYPPEVVAQHHGRTQILDDHYHLRSHELEHAWVNQLTRDHFTRHQSINLGVRGIGARAAVDQLHFVDLYNIRQGQGVVVLMLPGADRWDMFWKQPRNHRGAQEPDGYNTGEYQHEKWRTAWPIHNEKGFNGELFGVYARDVWSIQFTALNMMMAILTCQTWCSAHGYDMIMCNAYGDQTPGVYEWLREHCGSLTDQWDWNQYLHHHTNYTSFLELLVAQDGLMPRADWRDHHRVYNPRDMATHSTYLTNDEGTHPTILGHQVIAEELANFITKQGILAKE